MTPGFGAGLVIPDLWQQDAVRALQQGKDVVVQAPTGSGKTYIFELLYPNLKTQAVFTVPTRALANDKLSEWRARGWDVGISTGDVALNLDAKVVVATLETQHRGTHEAAQLQRAFTRCIQDHSGRQSCIISGL
jgi:replicative superfamily II helicase